jgi:hypothetical protein
LFEIPSQFDKIAFDGPEGSGRPDYTPLQTRFAISQRFFDKQRGGGRKQFEFAVYLFSQPKIATKIGRESVVERAQKKKP